MDSLAKKIDNPKYDDPVSQITDFSGIRVITYVESDVQKVCNVLESYFKIDPENSIDKSESLGVDKVGYRSVHYIAELPADRLKLPEYNKFGGMRFEIQVRTILQHAWAEIEHDKDYKFSGELPINLKRRFKILAGVLELADREFNGIAAEIDSYSDSVNIDTKRGNLDIPIDSTSIKSYLNIKFEELILKGMKADFISSDVEKRILFELKCFGITSLKLLDDMIPNDFVKRVILSYKVNIVNLSCIGLLRNSMMIANAGKYFSECWEGRWKFIDTDSINLIGSYNSESVKVIYEQKLEIIDIISERIY